MKTAAVTTKKPINLFIDTNILLGFYRFSADDLDKLNQLEDLIVKTKDIKLFATSQQVDEFYRNRDKVIRDVTKELSTSMRIPQLFSGHPDYDTVKRQVGSATAELERVKQETIEHAKAGALQADKIIARLFRDAADMPKSIIEKGRLRSAVGNPPGKNDSIGDAINWEYLLKTVPADEDLDIVSRDGDFSSALDTTKLNTFLQREWDSVRPFNVVQLHLTLNSLFKTRFPEIKLMGEYIKEDLIRQLLDSPSFDDSRAIIKKMQLVGDFSDSQAKALVKAAITNDQVYNAHKYSPELVGGKLWPLIKPYWNEVDKSDQVDYVFRFTDKPAESDVSEVIAEFTS